MTLSRSFFSFPFFWVCLSAFFFGAGFSRVTRFVRADRYNEKLKTRKWVIVCSCFSLCIISAICTLLLPGSKELADIKYLFLFLFFAGISFIGLRFKKAFGIPVLFLFIFCFFIILLFFQSLTSFTGETEIAKVSMLSVQKNFMTMDLVFPDNRSEILELKGSSFAPVVKVIIFDDLLVFFGIKTWYRFVGIGTFEKENEKGIQPFADSYEFKRGPGISRAIYRFFEEYEERIPGIKSVQTEVSKKTAKEFSTYSILVQNDGGVIVEIVK